MKGKRTRGERVIAFIEAFCPVPEGALVGQPMRLELFQKRFILDVYDNPQGTRRAILSIGRKNGKTALIAALVLAHVAGPEAQTNSQIVSGARSRDQAALVFNLAAKMVSLSPDLNARVRVVPSGKRLIGLSRNVEYRALAADSATAHGLSPVLAILDELGQVKGAQDGFVDSITTSQGAHDEPLLLVISTQAATDADMLSIWIDDARRQEDPHTVCHVYEAPEDAGLLDREAWKAANPALGKFRSLKDVEEQAKQAARMPSAENTFRNLILNQRVQLHSPFVGPAVWKANGGEPQWLPGVVAYAGLDLSQTLDLTAFVVAFRDDEGVVHWHPTMWTPADTLRDRAKRDRAPYEAWVDSGYLRAVPGKAIDYEVVAHDIAEICADLTLAGVAFDRWRIAVLQKEFDRLGISLPLVEFGQGFASMSPAIDAAERLLVEGKVRHGGHPVLTHNAASAVTVSDPSGNRKLDKAKSTGRIDGMVAAVMATGLMAAQVVESSDAGFVEVW